MKHPIKRLWPWSACGKSHKAGSSGNDVGPCRQCWADGVMAVWKKRINNKTLVSRTPMSLKEQLSAIVDEVLNEQKLDGAVDAAKELDAITVAAEAKAREGQRTLAYPQPTDKAAFLSKGVAYKLKDILEAEGLSVRVIPYKDIYFYLDMNW